MYPFTNAHFYGILEKINGNVSKSSRHIEFGKALNRRWYILLLSFTAVLSDFLLFTLTCKIITPKED